MANSTSRLALSQPVGVDLVSELRTAIGANATILDNAVTMTEGTLVNRPAGSYAGQTYYATDQGVWYFYTGSAWETVMLAGAWQAIALASGVTAASGYYVPSARMEGDIARLKGAFTGVQGSTGGSVGTLPAGMWPTAAGGAYGGAGLVLPVTTMSQATPTNGPDPQLTITTSGGLSINFQATDHYVYLDGLTFSLS